VQKIRKKNKSVHIFEFKFFMKWTLQLSKNITKLAHNFSSDLEMARERFRRDIAVLNFYYDTPIITGITLELRTSIFDMISAVGGTLGLFTGISVITLVEVCYWSVCFGCIAIKRFTANARRKFEDNFSVPSSFNLVRSTNSVDACTVDTSLQMNDD
jgi:hypothetical protein